MTEPELRVQFHENHIEVESSLMSPSASDQEISEAIIDHVNTGAYPMSEDVASAELRPEALPILLEGIDKSREAVKAELRELSRNTAPDLDGWIKQAKQLQKDIEQSKITAKEIVKKAEASKALEARVVDTSSKVNLLRNELHFNETLIGALEQLQIATGLLDKAKEAESENELVQAVKELGNAQRVTSQLDSLQNSRFGGLLQRRAGQIREGLVAKVAKCWNALVEVSHLERRITLHRQVNEDEFAITIEDTMEAMAELGTFETHISRLHREIDSVILGPRFVSAGDGAHAELHFGEHNVATSGRADGFDLASLNHDVRRLIDFLTQHLPQQAYDMLLAKTLPGFLVQLVTEQLNPSIPISVDELSFYASSLFQVEELAAYIAQWDVSLPSDGDLSVWVERLPQTWLSRRREATLMTLRTACYEAVKQTRTAERVETQMVGSDDVMVAGDQQEDDWNESWSDQDEEGQTRDLTEDDVDANAWGLDEEDGATEKAADQGDENEEDGDAWGWGDDDGKEEGHSSTRPAPTEAVSSKLTRPATKQNNGPQKKSKAVTQKKITLRETFAITAVPDTLLELINMVLSDAEKISEPSFPIPAITAATQALSPIPTLVLALFRATARSFYSSSPVADMLIYNDSQDLATRLGDLVATLPPGHPLARRLPRALEAEIKSLHTFSRLAYGREMDSQRTILSDLLSSTSGFASCTNPLNAREYTSAIEDVVARIRDIDDSWTGVLCDSARRQSLGVLLSHVIRKVVADMLELAAEPQGISEEESKQLKAYLDQVALLEDLFAVAVADGEARSLVHVYTPAWLRFTYLGEILDASLADIKFMWTESELGLEFEVDEVVELIEALFAESEYRRDAIRDIMRNAGGLRS